MDGKRRATTADDIKAGLNGARDSRKLGFDPFGSDGTRGTYGPSGVKWGENFPEEMSAAAYYGPLGRIVKEQGKFIETDTSALMVNMLVMSGMSLGRDVVLYTGATEQHANMSAVTVGESGENKTDGYNPLSMLQRKIQELVVMERARHPATSLDLEFPLTAKELGGLSTGEGLIWQIRDEKWGTRKVKDPNDPHKEITEDYLIDLGVEDKRLLIVEPEFAAVLTVMSRDKNILSTTLRLLYDGKETVENTSKANPITATGAHVGMIGMITPTELGQKLRTGDISNGFVNRIMWPVTRRIWSRPKPPKYSDLVEVHAKRWMAARREANVLNEITWSEEADARWFEVYERLRKGTMPGWSVRVGLSKEALSRVHVSVMRMAMIYAAFDGMPIISLEHLEAALAVAEYVERCGVYIFARQETDANTARLLDALRAADGKRLTRFEVGGLFSNHLNGAQLDAFLAILERAGRIRLTKESTGGRDRTVIELVEEKVSDEQV